MLQSVEPFFFGELIILIFDAATSEYRDLVLLKVSKVSDMK